MALLALLSVDDHTEPINNWGFKPATLELMSYRTLNIKFENVLSKSNGDLDRDNLTSIGCLFCSKCGSLHLIVYTTC